jgi:ribosomal-protein-alanine N-acetyltransferase
MADMPAIMTLEQELFPEDAWTPEMFAGEFAQPTSRRLYLVAEEGSALVGYAGMMFTGGTQADVVTLAVDRARWGEGTGTALLSALVDEAVKRGYAEVLLEVREDNPRARRLYSRHGFTEIGIRRGYYQPSGVNAVVMRKELS